MDAVQLLHRPKGTVEYFVLLNGITQRFTRARLSIRSRVMESFSVPFVWKWLAAADFQSGQGSMSPNGVMTRALVISRQKEPFWNDGFTDITSFDLKTSTVTIWHQSVRAIRFKPFTSLFTLFVSVPFPISGDTIAVRRDALLGDAVGNACMSNGNRAVFGARLLWGELHMSRNWQVPSMATVQLDAWAIVINRVHVHLFNDKKQVRMLKKMLRS